MLKPPGGCRPTERQKELLTGLSVIVIFVLGFGAAEMVLRLLQVMKYGAVQAAHEGETFYREEGTGLRLPKPGARVGRARINSLGFRGPEIPIVRASHKLRLAFLGSSTTYDAESPEGQNWPELTAQKVERALPSGCGVDFANAGVPGFGLEHILKHFEAHVRVLRPDVVLILAADITRDIQTGLAAKGVAVSDLIKPSWLGRQSLLWSKVEKNVHVIRLQRAATRPEGKIRFDHDAYAADFERRLTAVVETVKTSEALPVLVTTVGQLRREQSRRMQIEASTTALFYNPSMSIPGLLDARDAYNAAIHRAGQTTGVAIIDDHQDIPGDRQHFADSSHFSPLGSEKMAERVATALLANQAFRARIRALGEPCRFEDKERGA